MFAHHPINAALLDQIKRQSYHGPCYHTRQSYVCVDFFASLFNAEDEY